MLADRTDDEYLEQFMGEIETEIVAMQYHHAHVAPGERVSLEREPDNAHDPRAIRVENARFKRVGHLPRKLVAWLAPLIDAGKISVSGYIPKSADISHPSPKTQCPVVLMIFQCEKGRRLLERTEPRTAVEVVHEVVRQSYQDAQCCRDVDLIHNLTRGLRALEKLELLPESRLLMALLPALVREIRTTNGFNTIVEFRNVLGRLTLGKPTYHHNLTVYPLLWRECAPSPCTVFNRAVGAGEVVIEELSEETTAEVGATGQPNSVPRLAVTNRTGRPLLIPEGEILVGAKQNRVIDATVLVAAGERFSVPVHCAESGRWRRQSQHVPTRVDSSPPSRPPRSRAAEHDVTACGQAEGNRAEAWNQVHVCLDGEAPQPETASLADGFVSRDDRLRQYREHFSLPPSAAGLLAGRCEQILGMDLFDSPETFAALRGRLTDAYFFDAICDDTPAPPTCQPCAQRFLDRVSGAARLGSPTLGLGDELEIAADGLLGAALLYHGRLCHLTAFSKDA